VVYGTVYSADTHQSDQSKYAIEAAERRGIEMVQFAIPADAW